MISSLPLSDLIITYVNSLRSPLLTYSALFPTEASKPALSNVPVSVYVQTEALVAETADEDLKMVGTVPVPTSLLFTYHVFSSPLLRSRISVCWSLWPLTKTRGWYALSESPHRSTSLLLYYVSSTPLKTSVLHGNSWRRLRSFYLVERVHVTEHVTL